MSLAHPMREAREARGMTQEELARRAAVASRTVCAIERRECSPRPSTKRRLLKALGIAWEERADLPERPRRGGVAVSPWRNAEPLELPFQRRDTSEAAADAAEPTAGTLRARVLEVIRGRGAHGATDDEIEAATGLRHQTASARRRELVLSGLAFDSGERRATSSGRKAIAWRARQ